MQATKSSRLTARDFVYVYEPGIGQTYQNGPYLIAVGRASYACNYRGQCFSWGYEDFLSAIEACAKHDAARRAKIEQPSALAELEHIVKAHRQGVPSLYTRRCENAERGFNKEGK